MALADDAFESGIVRNIQDLYRAHIPKQRRCMRVHFKDCIGDTPIFRQATASATGCCTSPSKALRYHVFNGYLKRLGRSAGFEQVLTAYCIRRGTGNAVDGEFCVSGSPLGSCSYTSGAATEAERNQIMGHRSSKTFEYYLSERVKVDVQAAFLGSRSKPHLLTSLGSMGRSVDCRAPNGLGPCEREGLKLHPDVIKSKQKRDEMASEVRENRRSTDSMIGEESNDHKYRKAQKELNTVRVAARVSVLKETRRKYFRSVDTRDLDAQVSSGASQAHPSPPLPIPKAQPVFQERSRLIELLFQNTSTLPDTERLDCRIEAITNMVSLCHLREVRRQRLQNEHNPTPLVIPENALPAEVPLKPLDTQCLFCLCDSSLPDENRYFTFSCASAAKRHMQKQHLDRMDPETGVACLHPQCDRRRKLENVVQLKIHAARVHGVRL